MTIVARISSQTLLDLLEVPAAKMHSWHFPPFVESYGGGWVDGSAGSRSDAGRIQGAGPGLLSRRSEPANELAGHGPAEQMPSMGCSTKCKDK